MRVWIFPVEGRALQQSGSMSSFSEMRKKDWMGSKALQKFLGYWNCRKPSQSTVNVLQSPWHSNRDIQHSRRTKRESKALEIKRGKPTEYIHMQSHPNSCLWFCSPIPRGLWISWTHRKVQRRAARTREGGEVSEFCKTAASTHVRVYVWPELTQISHLVTQKFSGTLCTWILGIKKKYIFKKSSKSANQKSVKCL